MIRAEEKSKRGHWIFKKHCTAEDRDPRYSKRQPINHEKMRYLQKKQSTSQNTKMGLSRRRAIRCCNSLYRRWSRLLWPFYSENWATERKAMVLSVHMIAVKEVHIEVVSKLHKKTYLNSIYCTQKTKYNNQRQRGKFCWSWTRVCRILSAWNKEAIEKLLTQHGIRWSFNRPAGYNFGGVWERMVRSCKTAMNAVLGNWSVTLNVILTRLCVVEQTLNARPLSLVISDVNDHVALTLNHSLFGNKNVCLPYLPWAEEFINQKKPFQQTQGYANLIWDGLCKDYLSNDE